MNQWDKFLLQVLDNLFTFVGVLTPDGILLEANQAPLLVAGLSREDVIDKPFADAYWWTYSPEAQGQIRDAIAQASQGNPVRFDIPVQIQGGSLIIIDFSLSPLRDETGQITHLIPSGIDITERKRTETELRQNKDQLAQLAAIVESSQDAIISKTPEGIITSWNQAAERLFGYTAQEMIGHPVSRLIPIAHRVEEAHILDCIRQGKQVDTYETQRQRKDGSFVDVALTVSPIWDDNGQVVGASKIARDISDRKQAELQLRNLSNRLEIALDAGKIGIWDWDIANNNLIWDEWMYKLYGINSSDSTGTYQTWESTIHPEDLERCREALQQSFLNNKDYENEFRIIYPDGTIRYILNFGILQRNLQGEPLRMIGVNIDISDRKEAEIALRESEAKFSHIFQYSPDPVWIALLESGYFIDINSSLCDFLGATREEIVGHTCVKLGIWDNLEDLHRLKQILIQEGSVKNFEIIVQTLIGEKKTVLISAVQTWLKGQNCVISVIKDISERKKSEALLIAAKERAELAELELQKTQITLEKINKKLLKLVDTDGLTKIANRRCFNINLKQTWKRLYREQQPLSLILFDVDYFKYYNDLYGHPQGDSCLIEIAQTVRKNVKRPVDLVARFGGEEFVVILPNTDIEGATVVAEDILLAVRNLAIAHQDSKISNIVTISLGISCQIPGKDSSSSLLIKQADLALFEAKKRGRNQLVLFSSLLP